MVATLYKENEINDWLKRSLKIMNVFTFSTTFVKHTPSPQCINFQTQTTLAVVIEYTLIQFITFSWKIFTYRWNLNYRHTKQSGCGQCRLLRCDLNNRLGFNILSACFSDARLNRSRKKTNFMQMSGLV